MDPEYRPSCWSSSEWEDLITDVRWRFARPEFTKRDHYVYLAQQMERLDLGPQEVLFRYRQKLEPCLYMMIKGNARLRRPPGEDGRVMMPTRLTPGTIFGVEFVERAEQKEKDKGSLPSTVRAPYEVTMAEEDKKIIIAQVSLSNMREVYRYVQLEKEKEERKKSKRRASIKPEKETSFSVLTASLSDPKCMKGPKMVQIDHGSMLTNDPGYMAAAAYQVPKTLPPPKKKKPPVKEVKKPPPPPPSPKKVETPTAKRKPKVREAPPPPPPPPPKKKKFLVERSTRPKNVAQKKLSVSADYVPPMLRATEDDDDDDEGVAAPPPKSRVQLDFLKASLEKLLPLRTAPPMVKKDVVPKLVACFEQLNVPTKGQEFRPSAYVPSSRRRQQQGNSQQQHDEGEGFFVVQKGVVSVLVDGKEVKKVREGEFVGELSLLVDQHANSSSNHKAPEITFVSQSSDTEIFRLEPEIFRAVFQASTKKETQTRLNLLKKVPFLDQMTSEQIAKLASIMSVVDFKAGETLTTRADYGNAFYLLKEGTVECQLPGGKKKVVKDGEYFGESWLTTQTVKHKTGGDMVAKSDGCALMIDPETFHNLLGPVEKVVGTKFDSDDEDDDDDDETLTYTDEMLLEGITQLRWKPSRKLTKKQIRKIQSCLTTLEFHKGQAIWCQGETRPVAMCFVYKGLAERRNGIFKKKFGKKNFFGSNAFQHARSQKTLQMTVDQSIFARKDSTVIGQLLLEDYVDIFHQEQQRIRRKQELKQQKNNMTQRKVQRKASKIVPKSSKDGAPASGARPLLRRRDSMDPALCSPTRESSNDFSPAATRTPLRRTASSDGSDFSPNRDILRRCSMSELDDPLYAEQRNLPPPPSSSTRRGSRRLSRKPKTDDTEDMNDSPGSNKRKASKSSSSLRREQMRMSMPASVPDDKPITPTTNGVSKPKTEELKKNAAAAFVSDDDSIQLSLDGLESPRNNNNNTGKKKSFHMSFEELIPSPPPHKMYSSDKGSNDDVALLYTSMERMDLSSEDFDASTVAEDDPSMKEKNDPFASRNNMMKKDSRIALVEPDSDDSEYVEIEVDESVEEVSVDDDDIWMEEVTDDEWIEEVIDDDEEDDDDEPIRPQRPQRAFKLDNIVKRVVLGEGQFGQVWLATDKTEDPPHPYAFKIQSKFELIDQDKAEVCVAEQRLMKQLDHPNIIQLFASFQDKDFIYMLMDMINGGELFSVIHAPREPDEPWGLKEEQACFYAFVIADAVCYMHTSGFIYRDLKPENVLINNKGYPVLIDFGFAKPLKASETTYTMVGTPQYIPPEMILQTGHGQAADHWTLGIVIYEMLCGENPFHCDGMEDMELYRGILEDDFPIPSQGSHLAHDIIKKLIVKDPSQRLGSLAGGLADITGHPWFDGISKRQIRRQQAPAPWIPEIKDVFDAQHFDDWSHAEDKGAVKYPALSAKDQKLFEGFC